MRPRRRPATPRKPAAATREPAPKGADEPSIDELLELLKREGDEAVDIGRVRGSGNPAPRLRGDDV